MLALIRHHLRRCSWIALLAVFGLALAPTISHAVAHANGATPWTEICTPQGIKLVSLTGEELPADATLSPHSLEHCALCGLAASPAAPPAASAGPALHQGLSQAVPELFLQAPRPLFAWASAQPRAPPLRG
ncbi:MAG: DUF2946 family protein [Ideonella sp.]|nr:DUF2946 family protein [Ideonella sp.]